MSSRLIEFWTSSTFKARIKNFAHRTFYEAGSPNQLEIETYRSFLEQGLSHQTGASDQAVLVLGMTPSLRNLTLAMGFRLLSIDRNSEVIACFKDWVLPEYIGQETILNADWMNLPNPLEQPVNAILGDGAFGNILSVEGHRKLLQKLKVSLIPNGVLILRKILIPNHLSIEEKKAEALISQFREGLLTEAEFGFEMRIFGSYREAYCSDTCILDNQVVFDRYQYWFKEGKISAFEHEIVNRYYFGGLNLIISKQDWESMLIEEGFNFEIKILKGRSWYEYYPLYYCTVHKS